MRQNAKSKTRIEKKECSILFVWHLLRNIVILEYSSVNVEQKDGIFFCMDKTDIRTAMMLFSVHVLAQFGAESAIVIWKYIYRDPIINEKLGVESSI